MKVLVSLGPSWLYSKKDECKWSSDRVQADTLIINSDVHFLDTLHVI